MNKVLGNIEKFVESSANGVRVPAGKPPCGAARRAGYLSSRKKGILPREKNKKCLVLTNFLW